jgi:alkylhydroperoxidase/carboxymuconolactone decarboxylase family protein YurZ
MRFPIRLRSSQTTEGDTARVLGKLEQSGKDLPIIRVVANWPAGFRPFVLMADALLSRGVLTPRTRECVVLHLAARLGQEYEWAEHVPISAAAGVTDGQRAVLSGGAVPAAGQDFTAADVAAMTFAGQLLGQAPLAPDDWDAACAALGEDAAREVVFAVAWWAGYVPIVARSLVALALADRAPGDRAPGDRAPGDRAPGDRAPGEPDPGPGGPGS